MSTDKSRSQRDGAQQGERGTPNPVQVRKFRGGLDYPVDKAAVLKKAREAGADEAELDAPDRLPAGDYASPAPLSRELGKLG